jgi:hypothetical protein
MEERLVAPAFNIHAEDFARNLLALFDAGMIAVSSELPEDDTATRSGFSATLERFLALPKDVPQ